MNEFTDSQAAIPTQRIDGSLYERGGLSIRWLAYFGDGILTVVIGLIALILTGDVLAAIGVSENTVFLLLLLELFIIIFLYYPFMESFYMATPVKMLLGLRVVDTSGNRIGLLRSILRSMVKLICFVIPFGGLIGGLIGLMGDERRTLWDLLSRTKVIKKI